MESEVSPFETLDNPFDMDYFNLQKNVALNHYTAACNGKFLEINL